MALAIHAYATPAVWLEAIREELGFGLVFWPEGFALTARASGDVCSFRQVEADKAMTEHQRAQTAFHEYRSV
jgi:hypothetical protein